MTAVMVIGRGEHARHSDIPTLMRLQCNVDVRLAAVVDFAHRFEDIAGYLDAPGITGWEFVAAQAPRLSRAAGGSDLPAENPAPARRSRRPARRRRGDRLHRTGGTPRMLHEHLVLASRLVPRPVVHRSDPQTAVVAPATAPAASLSWPSMAR